MNGAAQWEAAARDVETMCDALGKPIDEGIKFLVTALNAAEVPTTGSCEGHSDWGMQAPWVSVEPIATSAREVYLTQLHALDTQILKSDG